jgi:hypothetical protein
LPGLWSLPLVSFSLPSIGCFHFITFLRVSSSSFYQRIETRIFFNMKVFKTLWSNLTSAWSGRLLVHFLVFFFHVNFLFLLLVWQYQGSGCLVWVCSFLFFLLVKCVQQRRLLCKNVLKVKGCSSSLQNFLSMFFLKTFLFAPFFFFSYQFFCHQFVSFNLTLMKVFERFMGLGSLNCSSTTLVH